MKKLLTLLGFASLMRLDSMNFVYAMLKVQYQTAQQSNVTGFGTYENGKFIFGAALSGIARYTAKDGYIQLLSANDRSTIISSFVGFKSETH